MAVPDEDEPRRLNLVRNERLKLGDVSERHRDRSDRRRGLRAINFGSHGRFRGSSLACRRTARRLHIDQCRTTSGGIETAERLAPMTSVQLLSLIAFPAAAVLAGAIVYWTAQRSTR
jgi:hypothetical protein